MHRQLSLSLPFFSFLLHWLLLFTFFTPSLAPFLLLWFYLFFICSFLIIYDIRNSPLEEFALLTTRGQRLPKVQDTHLRRAQHQHIQQQRKRTFWTAWPTSKVWGLLRERDGHKTADLKELDHAGLSDLVRVRSGEAGLFLATAGIWYRECTLDRKEGT